MDQSENVVEITVPLTECAGSPSIKKGESVNLGLTICPEDTQIYYAIWPQDGIIKIEENKVIALEEGKAQIIVVAVKGGYDTKMQAMPESVYEGNLSITGVENTSVTTLTGRASDLSKLLRCSGKVQAVSSMHKRVNLRF